MDSQTITPVEEILNLVVKRQHFILQGGAGSGKTESLKQVVQALVEKDPSLRIACITHTNKAADQISDRVQADISVSTIHSFLSSLIKPFGRNIKCVFPKLFTLPIFEAYGLEHYNDDDKERRLQEHKRFKKAHEKLAARRKIVINEPTDKVTGKRDYDKNSELYNQNLNVLIEEINKAIYDQVALRDADSFSYNDTIYDNFHDPSFGHDGLLTITANLFEYYPILGRILADRYNCIFIDEYQDANSDIIRVLLRSLPEGQIVIGLFGDSEQAIYEEGIGSAQAHIDAKEIILVEKKDNYRCSQPVIDVANQFRTDGLTQEIALKTLSNGELETVESRAGSAVFYYAIAPEMEITDDAKADKTKYEQVIEDARDTLVNKIAQRHSTYVQLRLTNKAIARDVGFGQLYNIFDKRFRDTRDEIKKTLDRLQFGQVAELIHLYKSVPRDRRAYNRLISKLRKQNFTIKSVKEKERLENLLNFLSSKDAGAYETVKFAMDNNLIQQSDSHIAFMERNRVLFESLEEDGIFKEFEILHAKGANTLLRMKSALKESGTKLLKAEILEERFEQMERDLRKKSFSEQFFSADLLFSEVLAFYDYEDEDTNTPNMTMHKTKGSGIDEVMVILHEYGWNQKYNFESCFSGEPLDTPKNISSRKLLYVACSRAKRNLICVRLVEDNAEADKIAGFFPEARKIELN